MPHSVFDQAAPSLEKRERRAPSTEEAARRSVERVNQVIASVFVKARQQG